MGEPLKLDIVFYNPVQEYYAGDTVSGIVLVQIERSMLLTDIQVHLIGKGNVSWSESTGAGEDKRTTRFSNKKIYLDQQIRFFHSDTYNSGPPFVGTHRFPFSIILPNYLPQSFEGKSGYVKYKAIASVQSVRNFNSMSNTCSTKRSFVVRTLLPIPFELKQLKVIDESHPLPCLSSCCLCWSFGEISARITTDKGGYLPGETIAFKAEIENSSRKDMSNVTLSLIQDITCFSKSDDDVTKKKYEKNTVGTTLKLPQKLSSQDAVTWSELYTVPLNTPATDLGGSIIIEMRYYLQLEVGKFDGCCAPKVYFIFPLMIGSDRPYTGH